MKYFDELVSPFVGFDEGYENGFSDRYEQLPVGRKILYATPSALTHPAGWQLNQEIKGLQFVYENGGGIKTEFSNIIPLQEIHVEQMMQLAKLTKPGPFGRKKIDFGSYFGIFEKDKLVAMKGQLACTKLYRDQRCVYPPGSYWQRLCSHFIATSVADYAET